MDSAFQHFEILGPRASLDRWMAALQDLGTCHLADAMHGLEGETGIGRPVPTFDEMQAEMIRSEAGRALRAVERVLPPSRTARGLARSALGSEHSDAERPDWQLGPAGGDADRLRALRAESHGLAGELRTRLESVRGAELELETAEARVAAARALAGGPEVPAAGVRILALPRAAGRGRVPARRLKADGLTVRRARAGRRRVLVAENAGAHPAVVTIAAEAGARVVRFPEELAAQPMATVLAESERERESCRQRRREARAALLARVAEHGPRARTLLDALDDADARMAARTRMAATRHVAAARVYVRREDAAELPGQLTSRAGAGLVVRPLGPAGDAPTVPRQVASVPLAALEGLRPATFGEVPTASLLAIFAPLAVAAVWADVAGGLILLVAGLLLGIGAGKGSPRRDTALLGKVAGVLCLVLGALSGRFLGAAGDTWFGTTWGLAPGVPLVSAPVSGFAAPFVGVLYLLGQVALALASWGLVLALASWQSGRIARGRARCVGALHFACVAGLAFAVLPQGHGLFPLWVLAPASMLLVFVLENPAGRGARALLFGLCLELVGVLRLVVVAGGALLLFEYGFAAIAEPTASSLLVLGPALFVGALAVLADPAHMAMGIPYDLGLGGRRVSHPFKPLTRRVRLAAG